MMITEEVLHRMEEAFSKPGTDTDRFNRAVAELRKAVTPDNQVAHRLTEGEMALIAGLIRARVERAALKEKERAEWQETTDVISREKRDEMIEAVKGEEYSVDKVDAVLKLAKIEVEPVPVLPGVCNSLYPRVFDTHTYIFAVDKTVRVGEVDGKHQTEEEREAYARLWCAAPKVVEKLVALIKWLEICEWSGDDNEIIADAVKTCREAGAKI